MEDRNEGSVKREKQAEKNPFSSKSISSESKYLNES